MATKKQARENVTATRAQPFRSILQRLIKDRVSSREDKERLAEFLGQSVSSIDGMLYYGEGGLDSWISALIFCYDLEPESLTHFFKETRETLKRARPVSESDRLWSEIEDRLDGNEKYYWASLIRASVEIQSEVMRKKKRR